MSGSRKRALKDADSARAPKKAKSSTASSSAMFGKQKDLKAFKKKQLSRKVRDLRGEVNRLRAANAELTSGKEMALGGLSAMTRAWDDLDRKMTAALVASGASPVSAGPDLQAAIAERKAAGGASFFERAAAVPLGLEAGGAGLGSEAAVAALEAAVGARVEASAGAVVLLMEALDGGSGALSPDARVAAAEDAARRAAVDADVHQDALAALEAKIVEVVAGRDNAQEDLRIEVNKTGKLRESLAEAEDKIQGLETKVEELEEAVSKAKKAASEARAAGSSGGGAGGAAVPADVLDSLEQYKQLAETRAAQIIALKETRIQLLTEVSELEAAAAGVVGLGRLQEMPAYAQAVAASSELAAEVGQLQKELATASAAKEAATAAAATAVATASAAHQKTLAEAIASTKRADDLMHRYRKERDDLAVRIKGLETRDRGAAAAAAEYRAAAAALTTALSNITEAAASASADSEVDRDAWSKLTKAQLLDKAVELAGTAGSVGVLGSQLEGLAAAFHDMEKAVEEVSGERDRLASQLAEATEAKAKAAVSAAMVKQERMLLNKKIGRLQDQVQAYKDMNEHLESSSKEATDAVAAAQKAMAVLETQMEVAKRESREASAAAAKSKAELAQEAQLSEAHKAKAATVAVAADELKAKLKAAEEAKTKLARHIKKMKAAGSGMADSLLEQEVISLRGLLNCGVCETRRKNCMISRCSHTFCRECIDANLAARNRNCPGCGQRYDKDDVLAFFL